LSSELTVPFADGIRISRTQAITGVYPYDSGITTFSVAYHLRDPVFVTG
jgi:hypothetical protein